MATETKEKAPAIKKKATTKKKTAAKKKTSTAKNKTLVIVESPSKAKTINKYLGRNYVVTASVGHIKDLVKFKLGVDVDNDFEPRYITIRGKGDIIKDMKKLAKVCKGVMIATDPDREGEAIAWHIAEVVKPFNDNVKRILFNEITKVGVKKGLEEPLEINTDLFMSQQARRVMDRLIGYQVSPFLSRAMLEKTSKALSAGRVQSVALRMLCERDAEIKDFEAIDYWNINADFFTPNKRAVTARLLSYKSDKFSNPEGSAKAITKEQLDKLNYIKSAVQATDLTDMIKKEDYSISNVAKKKVSRKPAAPFTTSSLQQEASRRLGFSNRKTMSVAQKLYEGMPIGDEGTTGLITYMRTDSVRLSPESEKSARTYVEALYGKDFIPKESPVYKSKSKNIQDAHEAIRPTSLSVSPTVARQYLDKDFAALYELIFNRFLASQMSNAQFEQTSVDISGGYFVFRSTGTVTVFKGFLAVYEDIKENGNGKKVVLPEGLEKDKKMDLDKVESTKSQTKAPAKYNSASLVKELDELGIGRPSTYASIVGTLLEREYVETEKKTFAPTTLGLDVNNVLVKNFPKLFDVSFTANMEANLDVVAVGDKTYAGMLKEFYGPFTASLEYAKEHGDIPEIICEECGSPMLIKVSRNGRFLGCSTYPDCRFTKPLPRPLDEEKKEPVIAEGVECDVCGKPMYIRESRYGKFYGCSDYPKCKGIKPFTIGVKCPKCGEGDVIERVSPKNRKKFYGCSRYPDCDYISNYMPVDQHCPECDHHYLETRFKKVDDVWEKSLRCPQCKTVFTVKAEEHKHEEAKKED
ncbi:MAG: type I DNA topoisomerase [Candidatus Kapabacteria bacterium]|jgi:DNA topoisomerase-1|nr:type I DNA topoisomerase [Candidatus Kapabacteria bacterium]